MGCGGNERSDPPLVVTFLGVVSSWKMLVGAAAAVEVAAAAVGTVAVATVAEVAATVAELEIGARVEEIVLCVVCSCLCRK